MSYETRTFMQKKARLSMSKASFINLEQSQILLRESSTPFETYLQEPLRQYLFFCYFAGFKYVVYERIGSLYVYKDLHAYALNNRGIFMPTKIITNTKPFLDFAYMHISRICIRNSAISLQGLPLSKTAVQHWKTSVMPLEKILPAYSNTECLLITPK